MRKSILLIFSILAITSCYNEFEVPFETGEDKLILNARFESHKTIHTVFLSYKDNGTLVLPNINPHVFIKINNEEEKELTTAGSEYQMGLKYMFEYQFKEGDTIELRAESNGKNVKASATFPSKIDKVSVLNEGDKTHFTFNDKPESEDYYRFQVDYTYLVTVTNKISGEVEYHPGHYDSYLVCDDPLITDMPSNNTGLLGELINSILPSNINYIFSDSQLNSPKVDVYFKAMNGENIPAIIDLVNKKVDITERSLNVYLQHLSLDDYYYFRSLNAGDSFGYAGNIIVEPTIVRSNVEGGSGYVAAITSTKGSFLYPDKIDIYDGIYTTE